MSRVAECWLQDPSNSVTAKVICDMFKERGEVR